MRTLSLVLLLAAAACVSQGRHILQDGASGEDLPVDENGFLTGPTGKPVPDAPATCSAFSSLRILATAGSCTGVAGASCLAVSESQSSFIEAYEEWWVGADNTTVDESKLCAEGDVEVFAQAIATAIAKVWADAFVKVNCDGQGFACGWSAANGEAFATAFAEALAFAAADASLPNVDAFCVADIRAISVALAEAAESARAQTCTDGGESTDFESNYAAAIVDAIATAYARATATACKFDDSVKADSECFGTADSGALEVLTAGDATVTQLAACEGVVKDTCCGLDRRFCGCDGCNGPLRKVSRPDETRELWEDATKTVCFCV